MPKKHDLWKLSPSGLYRFEECRSCFWMENHFGKAPSLPFVLNSAMDSLLKTRFDSYRAKAETPPEIAALQKEGVRLFEDVKTLDHWRQSTQWLEVRSESDGYLLVGKPDDILLEPDGRLIPVDFKSSGYSPKEDKQKYYVLQLNAYALMFRAHHYPPSDRGYLIHYFIKDVKNPSLHVEFTSCLDRVKLDLDSLEAKLKQMVVLLNDPYPGDNPDCKTCAYAAGRQAAKLMQSS